MNTRTMDRAMWICAIAATIGLLWLFGSLALTMFANGWLYRVEQPVEVSGTQDEHLVLRYSRYSRGNYPATYEKELLCEFLHPYGKMTAYVERGYAEILLALPMPNFDVGDGCVIQSLVYYWPVGPLGPRLSYTWVSEPFRISELPTLGE